MCKFLNNLFEIKEKAADNMEKIIEYYIEPVYLNEKMLLNCAAYTFQGVSLESEVSENKKSKGKGNLNLGFKYLQDYLSPINLSGEYEKEKSISTKTSKKFTLGGLHMTLINELKEKKYIEHYDSGSFSKTSQYVEVDAILKPIDFFSIIEILKLLTPLVAQLLQNFGDKIKPQIFTNQFKKELEKYESLFKSILSELEGDYLKSGLLEMIMVDPASDRQIGIVDVDLSDSDPLMIKAKLNDGHFKVIGRITKSIDSYEKLSLVQRTILSSVIDIAEKLASAGSEFSKYQSSMVTIKSIVEKFCQLSIEGPAIRLMAMSICI